MKVVYIALLVLLPVANEVLAVFIGFTYGKQSIYNAAIKANAGQWVADPETGDREFMWVTDAPIPAADL